MGKLIAHCEKSPIVVPIYHRGMDNVIPEKVLKDKKTKKPSTPISPIPRIGNDIRLFVGESLDFTEKVRSGNYTILFFLCCKEDTFIYFFIFLINEY